MDQLQLSIQVRGRGDADGNPVRPRRAPGGPRGSCPCIPSQIISGYTATLRTKILDFRGFDSSRILSLRGGILMSIGNFPEVLSQGILEEIILVGRLGVARPRVVVGRVTFRVVRPLCGSHRSSLHFVACSLSCIVLPRARLARCFVVDSLSSAQGPAAPTCLLVASFWNRIPEL